MYEGAEAVYAKPLDEIRAAGLEKSERQLARPAGRRRSASARAPAPVLNFCANNYLGLTSHPRVARGGAQRARRVRLRPVERALHLRHAGRAQGARGGASPRFLGTEDAILYSSCFDANGGLFETLLGEDDAIISDALNHASIIDGIRLCKAERHRYAHGDMAALEAALEKTQGKRLRMIATDGVFSMDGDLAPLERICDLADSYRALVMVDDSHATGFVGEDRPRNDRALRRHGARRRRHVDARQGARRRGRRLHRGAREIVDLLRQRSRPVPLLEHPRAGDRRREPRRARAARSSTTRASRDRRCIDERRALPRGHDAPPASASGRASTRSCR